VTSRPTLARGVQAEIQQAAAWYAERDTATGAKFVAAVDEAIRRTLHWPDAGSLLEGVRPDAVIRRVPIRPVPESTHLLSR
jgi:hypothetical protein